MRVDSDVLVIGSGFGGGLVATVLSQLGYQVTVVDKASHPRFAIGESSTPLADRTLKRIASRFQLDWLAPLCAYGTAQDLRPHVTVGLKRGFSYFQHSAYSDFHPRQNRSTELLIAASTDDRIADTHWLRSTTDDYIAAKLVDSGVRLIENFRVHRIERSEDWVVSGCIASDAEPTRDRSSVELSARFLIDASGPGSVFARDFISSDETSRLKTHTAAVYGHFKELQDWNDLYVRAGGDDQPHPYLSHRAAVHHLIDEGWVWQLGFDNGVTSCGIVLDRNSLVANPLANGSGEDAWQAILRRYPTLQKQFADAHLVAPSRLVVRERLQFLRSVGAGSQWLALPSAIGFVDPLHSTGIAHTLAAVEKIAEMFSRCSQDDPFPSHQSLGAYADQVRSELLWIDELVSMCYAARFDFSLFTAATLTYFVVVTSAEKDERDGFLSVNHCELVAGVASVAQRVRDLRKKHESEGTSQDEIRDAVDWIRKTVAPFNQAGLLNPEKQNLYHHTAPSDKTV
ncbi:NAD(P)/FAD-dependent oxidoreductase [Rhodopirellula sallentina]|uniref:FAD dependent oxidoreductase n=1 Tax=Rhodopirellula sallentina SM41 TaxID=1263870 RepID=M5TVY0_9BACT|nr:tryptophan 7-halogenase [Rhodopirellula sallentina]EMI53367.1 FAD dependent oxidoreductase [Rhodopirellula sallentina SM41]